MMVTIKDVESAYLKKKLPEFNVGDTVDVRVRITEGEKERTQTFTGIVIARRGSGVREMFTVRRIVQGEGVERVFPIHSPAVLDVKVVRYGRVRRAKLHYLRDRVGKAARVRARRPESRKNKASKAQSEADSPADAQPKAEADGTSA